MRNAIVFLFFLVIGSTPALAADTPASEQSIRQLLTVTETRKLLDNVLGQIDSMMKGAFQQALQGRMPSPREQEIIDRMLARSAALTREEMSWEKLEPVYLRIYRDSLTQDEVDGMIAFYQTPAGRALIRKMPLIVQNSLREMQAMMVPMMDRLKTVQDDALRELAAARGAR